MITKEQVERLIEVLGEKEYFCDCGRCGLCMAALSGVKPILIGDVLEGIFREEQIKLLPLWDKCGISKSLQEIENWQTHCSNSDRIVDGIHTCHDDAVHTEALSPKCTPLFEFLISIFVTDEE